jgi:hypothetical protein
MPPLDASNGSLSSGIVGVPLQTALIIESYRKGTGARQDKLEGLKSHRTVWRPKFTRPDKLRAALRARS